MTMRPSHSQNSQRGFTLLETMIATLVLTIGVLGVMALFSVAAARNASQGDQATRTAEYAEDKMEQLMALQFNDTTSDLTINPICYGVTCGGKGLAAGGTVNPTTTPASHYVDYVAVSYNADGSHQYTLSPTNDGAVYMREWQITDVSPTLKTIAIRVVALNGADYSSTKQLLAPSTTLICQKANYF